MQGKWCAVWLRNDEWNGSGENFMRVKLDWKAPNLRSGWLSYGGMRGNELGSWVGVRPSFEFSQAWSLSLPFDRPNELWWRSRGEKLVWHLEIPGSLALVGLVVKYFKHLGWISQCTRTSGRWKEIESATTRSWSGQYSAFKYKNFLFQT